MKVPENIIKLCNYLDDKKAENITIIDTTKMANVANYNIIATATSVTHTKTLADYVEVESQKGSVFTLINREGFNLSEWIILDFGEVFVHIFTKEKRDYYNLEKLLTEGSNAKSFEKVQKELKKIEKEKLEKEKQALKKEAQKNKPEKVKKEKQDKKKEEKIKIKENKTKQKAKKGE